MSNYEYNLDKVKGCIVGGAAGDALGYPVEFHSSIAQIRQEYGPVGITRFKLHPDGTAHFSDDTQMTLFTASGFRPPSGRNGTESAPLRK